MGGCSNSGVMANNDFFSKLRVRRSVLKRTGKFSELPEKVLYVEWLSNEGKRKVLDVEGKEHAITDRKMQSNYKMATRRAAKKMIAEHWSDAQLPVVEQVRKEST